MDNPIGFRWLGTAGVELVVDDQVILIDPYVTRSPLWQLWGVPISPNLEVIAETVPRCDFILATHAHWDHILDIPDIVRNTGAPVWGGRNTCQLLSICGVPDDKIHEIRIGDAFSVGPCRVEVFRSDHVPVAGFQPGFVAPNLPPPLRATDYRMDKYFSFRITIDGLRVLTDPGSTATAAASADVVFVIPIQDFEYYEELLRVCDPKVIVPYHCDDYFRPYTKPFRPCLKPPRWWPFPPFQQMDVEELRRWIAQLSDEVNVFVPDRLTVYNLREVV